MKFVFNQLGVKVKECDIEVFSNKNGIVVKFFDVDREPTEDKMIDYVYVEAGYGFLSLKQKGEDRILSGFLKKDFFDNSLIIDRAMDAIISLLPNSDEAYTPYNIERVILADAKVYTGETFRDIDKA